MKKRKNRLIAAFITAVLLSTVLSACINNNNTADWEDTLPSASTKASSETVQVITEETSPPISIEMPETTTTVPTTKSTELATTTAIVEDDDDYYTTNPSVTGISQVPVSEFTSTSPSSAESVTEDSRENSTHITEFSDGTLATNENGQLSGSAGTAVFSEDINDILTTTDLKAAVSSDKPYVFNDPISRPYCYSTLNTTQRKLYDMIIKAIQKHETEITFPDSMSVTSADYTAIYQMIYNSEHSIYYIDTQMKYTTNAKTKTLVSAVLCYTYTQDEINTMQKKIDAAANKIIGQINAQMTEYDIVKLFFDSLVQGCIYDSTGANCRDIYGCLVEGRAVCGGYAKAFSYLCDKVGIQTLTITGDADEIPHMWNMVKIGGEWYHIDVTAGFVKNAVTPYVRYDYFCVDDACISKTRTVYDQDYAYPAATATKYYYYNYNKLFADSWSNAREMLINSIISATSRGETIIQISCTSDEAFDEVVYNLFDQKQALTILDSVYDSCEKKYNRESITYNQDKSTRVIKLFLVYLD